MGFEGSRSQGLGSIELDPFWFLGLRCWCPSDPAVGSGADPEVGQRQAAAGTRRKCLAPGARCTGGRFRVETLSRRFGQCRDASAVHRCDAPRREAEPVPALSASTRNGVYSRRRRWAPKRRLEWCPPTVDKTSFGKMPVQMPKQGKPDHPPETPLGSTAPTPGRSAFKASGSVRSTGGRKGRSEERRG